MNSSALLDRRQFLKSGTRYALLTGMGFLAVAAEAKRRRLDSNGSCIRVWTCADCAEFGYCAKPKAQEYALKSKSTSDSSSDRSFKKDFRD